MSYRAKSMIYSFEELPLVIENDVDAGLVCGQAELEYECNGEWIIIAITLDGYARRADGKRIYPQVAAPAAVAAIIDTRLNKEWHTASRTPSTTRSRKIAWPRSMIRLTTAVMRGWTDESAALLHLDLHGRPRTLWNVNDGDSHEWIRRFHSAKEASDYIEHLMHHFIKDGGDDPDNEEEDELAGDR